MPLHNVTDKASRLEFDRVEGNLKIQTGVVVEFYGRDEDVPLGWLRLNGQSVEINDYPILYQLLKNSGKVTTDTTMTFRLPSATGKIIKV